MNKEKKVQINAKPSLWIYQLLTAGSLISAHTAQVTNTCCFHLAQNILQVHKKGMESHENMQGLSFK